MKQKDPRQVLWGYQRKIKGKQGENYFINCCKAERLCYFRIEDAGKPSKKSPKGFTRFSQVCDFIVSIKGNFWLLDTKMRGKIPTYSYFFAPPGRDRLQMSSPQRQADDFIKAFRHGNKRCGFLIKQDNLEYGWKFLSGETLANAKSNKDIIFSSVGRVSDLEGLISNC